MVESFECTSRSSSSIADEKNASEAVKNVEKTTMARGRAMYHERFCVKPRDSGVSEQTQLVADKKVESLLYQAARACFVYCFEIIFVCKTPEEI